MDEVTFNEHTWTLENPWVVFNETHNQRKYSESLDRRSLTGTYPGFSRSSATCLSCGRANADESTNDLPAGWNASPIYHLRSTILVKNI